MKKILLIAVSFICFNANAQYYQHVYGKTGIDNLCDGLTPQVGAAGYFMVGVSNNSGPGELLVVRSDQSGGTAGTGYFANYFSINNNGFPLDSLEVAQAKCIERTSVDPNLNGMMAVVGEWQKLGTSQRGYFYCEITSTGSINFGPINIYDASNSQKLILGSVAKGTLANGDPEALYITGHTENGSGVSNAIVIKYDMQAHTIVWDRTYVTAPPFTKFDTEAYDIIEDPQTPNRVLAVGKLINTGTNDEDGFVMTIDGNNGNPTQFDVFGTVGKTDYLTSISPANDPVGFILGGVTEKNNPYDMWALKLDNALGLVWTTARDYNNGFTGTNEEYSHNVIERYNTSGQYEYYQIGSVYPGVMGGGDMSVYKLDFNGFGVGNGQFTYGDGGNDDASTIDFANPSSDGFIAMGTYEDPLNSLEREFYNVRAYFNGETSHNCNFDLRNTATDQNGPLPINSFSMVGNALVSTSNYGYSGPASLNSTELCFSNTVIGGDNARVAPQQNGDKEGMVISPNPMAQGTISANISLEVTNAEQVSVSIFDMVGRQCYQQNFETKTGDNQFMLDLSTANMSQGMYSIRVQGSTIAKTILLMVK